MPKRPRPKDSDASTAALGFEKPLYRCPRGTVSTIPVKMPDGNENMHIVAVCAYDLESSGFYCASETAIFRVSPSGTSRLVAGSLEQPSGQDDAAAFEDIFCLALSSDKSTIFVVDNGKRMIRTVNVATGTVTTLAGGPQYGDRDGIGAAASFTAPIDSALSLDESMLYVADRNGQKNIRCIEVATGTMTTLITHFGQDTDVSPFLYLGGLALSADGSTLYVTADKRVFNVELVTGKVTILAGSGESGSQDGVSTAAMFDDPMGLVLSPDGSKLFVADCGCEKIRSISVATGNVTTLAGSGERNWKDVVARAECTSKDGVGAEAFFHCPDSVVVIGTTNGPALAVVDSIENSPRLVTFQHQSLPRLVIPPSSLITDLQKMMGNKDMPEGKVSFVVGPGRQRFDHISRNILCVRSEYFLRMLSGDMQEAGTAAADIEVPDTSPAAFDALLKYLMTDKLRADAGWEHLSHVLALARKYQVRRLELLCQQQLEGNVTASNVLPLLEMAHARGDDRLRLRCREYVVEHSGAVRRSGAVGRLRDLCVSNGLLQDALGRVDDLESAAARATAAAAT